MRYFLAVDIGASSGRHILGSLENDKIVLEEIYRFDNNLVKRGKTLCWDLEALAREVKNGLKACKEAGKLPVSMGIDTWAVDFVLLDENNAIVGDSVAYRDTRTQGMWEAVHAIVPEKELYERTGIQKQLYNTIYQLAAVKQHDPAQLEKASRFLMIPDYLNFTLTGVQANEYTNATSTGLVNVESKTWDSSLLEKLGYPARLFSPLCLPGTVLGPLSKEVEREVGFSCQVMLPATHDTGSAFLAVPAKGENAVYLSSGTWSLLGVENEMPITSEKSREIGFTNEGGYLYRTRYLKNIMGLWMIQSIRREQKGAYSFSQLCELAVKAESFTGVVDVNHFSFMAPDSMVEAVKAYCRESGQPVPNTLGEVLQCVYRSLARSYGEAIRDLESLTGKRYTSLQIVGGGSQDSYLNQLSANETGLPVFAGPVEGSALGNIMVQMIETKEIPDLEAARKIVRNSFAMQHILPQ